MKVANFLRNTAEFEDGTVYEHRGKRWLFLEPLHYDVHRYWLICDYPGWMDNLIKRVNVPTEEQAQFMDKVLQSSSAISDMVLFQITNPDQAMEHIVLDNYEYLSVVTPQCLNYFIHDCFFFITSTGNDTKLYCCALCTQDNIPNDNIILALINNDKESVFNLKLKVADKHNCTRVCTI